MSSINKILNDALDQTLLKEDVEIKQEKKKDNLEEGRFSDMVNSMGQPGYAGGKGKEADNLRANHPNATDSSALQTTLNNAKDAVVAAAKNPWVQGSTAAIGAGIGALLLAKKLRAKKEAAKKKAKK